MAASAKINAEVKGPHNVCTLSSSCYNQSAAVKLSEALDDLAKSQCLGNWKFVASTVLLSITRLCVTLHLQIRQLPLQHCWIAAFLLC